MFRFRSIVSECQMHFSYTFLQGESPTNYRQNDFRIFKNGSLWRPPVLNPYAGGLAETDSEDELPMSKTADAEVEEEKPEDADKVKGELREE